MDGVLLLDKPAGMTSHDCVNRVRRILNTKKVGHTGTLDPNVTGVLPLCIGRATKISQFLTAQEKEYIGEATLGFATTTEDADGEEVQRQEVERVLDREEVLAVFAGMLGTRTQVPPMYSAVKVKGRKLYEYARAGLEVERPQRQVTIYELELLGPLRQEKGLVSFSFRVRGSKGLFVRTVAVEIGSRLGYPAHMSKLRRVASGVFKIGDCLSLEELERQAAAGRVPLMSLEAAMADLPRAQASAWVEKLVRNGVQLNLDQLDTGETGPVAVYSESGQCLAVYEKHPEKPVYRSVRGFY